VGKQLQVTIEKNEDGTFVLSKNKNLHFLSNSCHSFYNVIMDVFAKQKPNLELDFAHLQLIERFHKKDKSIILTEEELRWLTDWINTMCIMIIEMNTVEFGNVYVKRFFKMATNFIQKTKEIIPGYEPCQMNEPAT